ncbi:hypothetical protein KAJ27_11780 [bacterium]|nr:hypothetical protein [bacterium]
MKNPKLVLLINVLGLVLVLAVAAFMISEQKVISVSFGQKSFAQLQKDINSVQDINDMKRITLNICKTQILFGATYLNRVKSDVILLIVISFLFLVNLAVYYGNKKPEEDAKEEKKE